MNTFKPSFIDDYVCVTCTINGIIRQLDNLLSITRRNDECRKLKDFLLSSIDKYKDSNMEILVKDIVEYSNMNSINILNKLNFVEIKTKLKKTMKISEYPGIDINKFRDSLSAYSKSLLS